ncbi:FHA domain-containing protein [Corallococcus aberystwythensis]|uniref:FHA domain-containing protein n=1 Tax=Corallococcus aberystwythensis TaxID=2316722 RepID=UPI001FC94CC4
MKIGRTSENDLVLHDHGVSRRHARITARDGRYFAEDVGSANGTQLNGQPLGSEKQLRDGDRITVGPVELMFVWVAPEDDDDVTRPIRRVLAPPHAKVSPQGLEQASLAEIEAAPTSYQQSMPAMARPASTPRPGMAVPAAKGGAAPAVPVASPAPQRTSAPDLPSVGAASPAAAAPARAPVAPPVSRAPAPVASAPVKAPAGPPVLAAASPGRSSASGLPAVAAAPANKVSAPVRSSGPGLPAVGASGRASGPSTPAPQPSHPTALELPLVGAPASVAPAPAVASTPPQAPPLPGPLDPAASAKPRAAANLPGVGAPALNRPELGRGAARASAASASRSSPASVSGLPVMTPPGLMAPPPPPRAPAALPPVDLAPVVPDEPEERTLMAIPTMESPGPVPMLAPVLPVPDLDEPEERTLMAIPATPEAPFLDAPPLVGAAPPQAAVSVLPLPTMEEPEERTVLDLRPITPVRPLVAPPVRVGSVAPPAPGSPEPATFVGQDDAIPADPPEETRASGTFAGQDAPVPAPALAPPPVPSPEPATFVGRKRSEESPALDAGPLLREASLLAPSPDVERETTQPLPPDLEASFTQPVPNGPVTVVAKVEPSSAADKARQRRQLGKTLQGRFLLFWKRQSLPRRIGFASLAGLGALVVLTLLVALAAPSAIRLPGREPSKLGLDPVTDSFGLGEGVRWVHADDKLFDFRFVSPTRAVAVLHYQASSIARDEVNLSLNGVSLGWVPPDTAQTAERELEQVLPPSLLRRNANNQLLFDNALNPPGRDPWRIWNLRLEIIPVPELPPEQLVTSARESAKTGARFYELKDVGAENLFKAWREYRAAWITLEALDDKPELYDDVRERIAQISTELDHRCGQLMMQFQRAVQFRSRRDAVATLEDVRRRFPTTEHRCHNLALEKAYEHEL